MSTPTEPEVSHWENFQVVPRDDESVAWAFEAEEGSPAPFAAAEAVLCASLGVGPYLATKFWAWGDEKALQRIADRLNEVGGLDIPV